LGLRHTQAVRVVGVHQRGGDTLGAHHPPGGAIRVCEGAIGKQVAAIVPSIRLDAGIGKLDAGQAIRRVVNVGVNANGISHYFTVAHGIILIAVILPCGVLGGDQAIERVVGVADLARDAAAGLRDARAVAGGVQGVGVAGEESAVVGVRQGGQAAGGVVEGAVAYWLYATLQLMSDSNSRRPI